MGGKIITNWVNVSSDVKEFIYFLLDDIKRVIESNFLGFYLHGSLAMGGFNPVKSDIDCLIVTHRSLNIDYKRQLARLFLKSSNNPFPVEVSFLNREQLKNWTHPSPFDFHYSEFWRERYEKDLSNGTSFFLNEEIKTDPDIAAHLTITKRRGICLEGPPIETTIPTIPRAHYISSIMGDYQECLDTILNDPIYCTLNLLRVYWFLKDSTISSKLEAGQWGLSTLPKELVSTLHKINDCYSSRLAHSRTNSLDKKELLAIKKYIEGEVNGLLK